MAHRSPKGIPAPTPYLNPDGTQRTRLDENGKTLLGWRIRFTHPKDGNRTESRVWTRTPQEAATLLSEAMKESDEGLKHSVKATKTTLYSWLTEWSESYRWVRPGVERTTSTWKEHESNVRLYLQPYLNHRLEDTGSKSWAKKPVSQFRTEDLEEIIESFTLSSGKTPSDSMRKSVTKTLRMAYTGALKKGLLSKSPADAMNAEWEIQGVKSFTPSPWEMESVSALMGMRLTSDGEIVGEPINYLAAMVRFLFWSGLRPAEALALRRNDVDFDLNHIVVTKQATVSSGRRVEKPELKTRQSKRIVILMPEAHDYAYWLFDRSKGKSDYLLMGEGRRAREKNDAGEWVTMETVRAIGYGTLARYLRWASELAIAQGVITESVTMTSLRHGFASSTLSIGMAPGKVSGYMGHSSTRLTTGLYGLDRIPTDLTSEVEEIRLMAENTMYSKRQLTKILDGIQLQAGETLTPEERTKRVMAVFESLRESRKPLR